MHVSFETSIVINFKMAISELILTLPPDTKSLIRSIEKTNRKIINTQLSLVFNKTAYIYYICKFYWGLCDIKLSWQLYKYIYIYIYIYIVNDEWLPGFIIIISILLVDTTGKNFSSLLNKLSFRHKAQFGHYQGTKYTLINSTKEL